MHFFYYAHVAYENTNENKKRVRAIKYALWMYTK